MGLILLTPSMSLAKGWKIYLIDEIHTPDSSRYFYLDGYKERFEKGEEQRQLSKEFVREWLMANGFQGRRANRTRNDLNLLSRYQTATLVREKITGTDSKGSQRRGCSE